MKQLAYHMYFDRRSECFVYHEFYFWYLGNGRDDYRHFKTHGGTEAYAKNRGASPVCW
jgi:hypothetical protein